MPERERQIGIIGDLISPVPEGALLVKLSTDKALLAGHATFSGQKA